MTICENCEHPAAERRRCPCDSRRCTILVCDVCFNDIDEKVKRNAALLTEPLPS